MPGDMYYFETTRDGKCFPWDQRFVDRNRVESLLGMEEQVAQNAPQETGAAAIVRAKEVRQLRPAA